MIQMESCMAGLANRIRSIVLVPCLLRTLLSRTSHPQGARLGHGWATFHMERVDSTRGGLLHAQDWTAHFITPDWKEDITRPQPAPFLRREFNVQADVRQARLYITALGVLNLN